MALSGQGENQRVGIEFKDGLKKHLNRDSDAIILFCAFQQEQTQNGFMN